MISFCGLNKCLEWNFCPHDKVMYHMCFLLSSESWNLFSNYRKYWWECTWHWLHELSGFAPCGSLCCWWGKISCILTSGIEKGLFHSHFIVVVVALLFLFLLFCIEDSFSLLRTIQFLHYCGTDYYETLLYQWHIPLYYVSVSVCMLHFPADTCWYIIVSMTHTIYYVSVSVFLCTTWFIHILRFWS